MAFVLHKTGTVLMYSSSATRRRRQLLRVSSPQRKSETELYKQSPFAVDFNTTLTGWLACLQSMSGIRLVLKSSFASLLKSTLSAWTAHNKLRSSIDFLYDSTLFAFSKVCNEFKASFDLKFDEIFMIWPGIRPCVNFTLQWLHVLLVRPPLLLLKKLLN